jgi:hypothetical protein
MLNERKLGVERVNNMFGTNISVTLNPKYEPLNEPTTEGGEDDEQ